jgi:hypothetical protein
MIEVLVAMGVGATILLALQSSLIHLSQSQQKISLKSEALILKGFIQSALMQTDSCNRLLGLDASPREIDLPFPRTENLSSLRWASTVLQVGGVYRGLRLASADLEFPAQNSSTLLQANLRIRFYESSFSENRPNQSHEIESPISLVAASDPQSNRVTVTACVQTSSISNFQETCVGMGGRWLEATDPGTYMPRPRCALGSQLDLLKTELPNGIPANGTRSSSGERVDECYYQPFRVNSDGSVNRNVLEPVVRTWACVSVVGNRRGNRCSYNSQLRSWTVQLWDRGAPSGTYRHVCSAGVRVSQRDESFRNLAYYERIGVAWNQENIDPTSADQVFKELDRYKAVKRCKFRPDVDSYLVCGQTTDERAALEGRYGACMYVRDAKLYLGDSNTDAAGVLARAGYITTYNQLNPEVPISTANGYTGYTGWIWVMSGQHRTTVATTSGTTRKWQAKEARGMPCFEVEVETGLAPDTGLTHSGTHPASASVASEVSAIDGNVSNPPVPLIPDFGYPQDLPHQLLYNEPHRIKQCVHVATPASNQMVLGKSGVAVPPYNPQTSVMQTLSCDNSTLTPYQAGGDRLRDFPESVAAGSCLFVRNVQLANNYTAPAQRYTGWVRFNAPIASNLLVPQNATTIPRSIYDVNIAGMSPETRGYLGTSGDVTINALPCNGGIRYDGAVN